MSFGSYGALTDTFGVHWMFQGETINQRALVTLFKEVIKNNRAGGWRKVMGNQ